MPTFETLPRFKRDWKNLDAHQQSTFRKVVTEAFVPDLAAADRPFRPGLRVKGVAAHPGIFEMTWDNDGRATFSYGPEQVAGEPHVIWRRIGISRDLHPTTWPLTASGHALFQLRGLLRLFKLRDEAALPGSFDRARRVVRPDVFDGLLARNAVEYREAGQRGPGASLTARTSDLDPLRLGPGQGLFKGFSGGDGIGREPEIRPAQPASLPRNRRRLMPEQIERERRRWPIRQRPAQPTPPHEPADGSRSTPTEAGSHASVTNRSVTRPAKTGRRRSPDRRHNIADPPQLQLERAHGSTMS